MIFYGWYFLCCHCAGKCHDFGLISWLWCVCVSCRWYMFVVEMGFVLTVCHVFIVFMIPLPVVISFTN